MPHMLVIAAEAYVAIGAMVAVWFLFFGIERMEAARGAYAFRPLLIPGAVLLWPLIVLKR